MKNIFLGLLGIALLSGTVSCHDFLEEKPKSNMTSNQYFTEPDHARAVVNILYREGALNFFQDGTWNGTVTMMGGYISGLFNHEYKGQQQYVSQSLDLSFTAQTMNSRTVKMWEDPYKSIGRANTSIKYTPETPGLTEEEKNNLIAQAKFFRAFNYYYLVKFFGDVPLILEPYESLDDLEVPRTPAAQVYDQMVADLKDAIPYLNDAAFTKNGFRITKPAAETLLANVYLHMSGYPVNNNNYKNAADAARSVINGGKHTLLTHSDFDQNSAYLKLKQDDNLEFIYSKEFNTDISDSDGWKTWGLSNSWIGAISDFQSGILVNVYEASDIIVNAYDPEKDLRIQEKQFYYKEFPYPADNGETLIVPEGKRCMWRYCDLEAILETGIGTQDIPVFRYAELLLIAAEAIVQDAGQVTDEAVGYLAQVKGRAYYNTPEATIVSELKAMSAQQFIEEVWAERIRELALDFKIWDDIQRTRKYPQTSASNPGKVTFRDVVGSVTPTAGGRALEEKHLLWPIPVDEIQRNPVLGGNNPGY